MASARGAILNSGDAALCLACKLRMELGGHGISVRSQLETRALSTKAELFGKWQQIRPWPHSKAEAQLLGASTLKARGGVLPAFSWRLVRAEAARYGGGESADERFSGRESEEERERERELLRALNLDPEDPDLHPGQDRDRDSEGEEGGSSGDGEQGAHAKVEATPESNETEEVARRDKGGEEDPVSRALSLDPEIPGCSTEFLAKVSSPEYQMRRRLEHTLSATAFDVVEANPWRESDKSVFVLAKEDEQLYTMRTRRPRREVEYELELLFFRRRGRGDSSLGQGRKGARSSSARGGASSSGAQGGVSRAAQMQHSGGSSSSSSSVARSRAFRVHVEDIREGILVFEDEAEAAQYCRVLDRDAQSGSECMGVAQFQAKDLFKVCEKSKALAVIFKKGSMPPSPEYLRHTLKARKQSLEDSDF